MVNINKVYERVQLLANKDQRGYITPEEFNSFAVQSQLEVFEDYFVKKAQASAQQPGTTDDYTDIARNLEEKITFFDNVATIASRGGSATTSDNAYQYPDDFYRLGIVTLEGRVVDEVSHMDLTYVNLSPLTAPTQTQPVYSRHEGGVVVYPTSYTGPVNMVYVRKPVDPVWAFVDNPTAQPVYDPNTSVNFEIHASDEQNLVYKILGLSGITIVRPDITNVAAQKEGQISQTEA